MERNRCYWLEVAIKKLSILGSTGSIGRNALKIVEYHRDKFEIIGLSANVNADLLVEQALKFQPKTICIIDESRREFLEDALSGKNIEIYSGRAGLLELASRDDADLLLNAIVGSAGMEPTINGIKSGTDIALSNKESLVMAGKIINDLLRKYSVDLYPVDSEHSAIWQCLQGEKS
ncbi:MAG: 1-deoxy-D-xylulose-5-phosphate reductoisomerase, partial [Candidatus Marinimicrobia bacterium]|nr:1-deoxy-D-xylulose-5-phosphate reductoisomerase [Candidatus Neomarinimicrobiota bacterium]